MSQVVTNFPFAEYRKAPGVNQSSFSDIDPDRGGCPAIYAACRRGEGERPDSDALNFGRAFHAYALERDTFAQEFVIESLAARDEILATSQADAAAKKRKVPEKFSRRLGAYQAWKDQVAADGKTLLTEFDADKLERMHSSLLGHGVVGGMLTEQDRRCELSLFANLRDHAGREIECKGRLDLLTGGGLILDLKTVADASPRSLGNFVAKYKLHVQAAYYSDLAAAAGIDSRGFAWAFCDKRAPFPVVFYQADPEMIDLGRREYRSWLGWIIEGEETGKWPGHSDMVELPGWFTSTLEEI